MNETDRHLKVFFLEDNLDDVDLELHELRKAGFFIEHEVARNRREFLEKLSAFPSDIILADYSLPDITGVEAIAICRTMNIDVPVILITGEGNEQIAVDSLRLGALDYIIKRNISGLPARVSRALEIWNDRKAKERAEAEEKRLQHLLFETQKMEAIGRLTGGIAHDFNNILTGIIGYSELCMKKVSEESELHHKLESIIAFSRKGADLVKQLLIFSKKIPLEFEAAGLNSFVRETVQFLKRVIEETIEIKLELQEDIPMIRCDTRQFTQVLLNLALNARDAMNGKGVLTIRTGKGPPPDDPVAAKPGEGQSERVSLTVSDTGMGIDKDDLPKIFDPFFTTKQLGKGTGLGLSIVYSVVSAHGGTIKVSSEKGRGSSFTIYLPPFSAHEAEIPPVIQRTGDAKKDVRKTHGSETILIAEDEDLLRTLAATLLSSMGYKVIAAKDGQEALDMYKSGRQKIDLVISDMLMPNKDGMELFRELKSLDPRVKFILVTGYSIADRDRDTLDKMDVILPKPYSSAKMAQVIRDVLDKRPS